MKFSLTVRYTLDRGIVIDLLIANWFEVSHVVFFLSRRNSFPFYSKMHGIDTSVPRFVTTFWGARILVTPNLISKVLHVLRVAHPDYHSCDRLQTVSKEELISHFCETPSIWGGKLNTPCSSFAKSPRFLNMVMTFTLTPLSHYNSITKPRACFLLSLMKDLSIDFPFHLITSIIDVYQDTATCEKLIFPSAIIRIL